MVNPRRAKRTRKEEAEVGVMDERWQSLPGDILLQNILPLVRCPDLCRFRTVCTKWNHLISKPEFQETVGESEPSFLLTSAAVVRSAKQTTEKWDAFDTETAYKHYALNQTFLTRLPVVKAKCSRRYARYSRITVAADKGFICMLWRRSGEDEMMCVVNPVTKSYREVPCYPRGLQTPFVVMAVASDSKSFQLFIVGEETCLNDHRCFKFDSRVGEWRPISDPPLTLLEPRHMLKRGNQLLTIFCHRELDDKKFNVTSEYQIFAYDIDEDVWTNTEVRVPAPRINTIIGAALLDFRVRQEVLWAMPQLVACGGRLFFAAWPDFKISIWEIDLEHKTCAFVAESSVSDAEPLLVWPHDRPNTDPPKGSLNGAGTFAVDLHKYSRNIGVGSNIVLAHGTDDCRILFSSVTRSCLAFVLSDRSWIRNPLGWNSSLEVGLENSRSSPLKTIGWFASLMSLTLRPVPEVVAGPKRAEPSAV